MILLGFPCFFEILCSCGSRRHASARPASARVGPRRPASARVGPRRPASACVGPRRPGRVGPPASARPRRPGRVGPPASARLRRPASARPRRHGRVGPRQPVSARGLRRPVPACIGPHLPGCVGPGTSARVGQRPTCKSIVAGSGHKLINSVWSRRARPPIRNLCPSCVLRCVCHPIGSVAYCFVDLLSYPLPAHFRHSFSICLSAAHRSCPPSAHPPRRRPLKDRTPEISNSETRPYTLHSCQHIPLTPISIYPSLLSAYIPHSYQHIPLTPISIYPSLLSAIYPHSYQHIQAVLYPSLLSASKASKM